MYPLTIGSLIPNRSLASEIEGALREHPFRNVLDENEVGDWSVLLERIDSLRPDVFLVEVSSLSGPAEEHVRRIRSTVAKPLVVVIDDEMRPDRILEVMRAGATEYLYPPLGEGLVRALEAIAVDFSQTKGAGAGGTALGVFSAKGRMRRHDGLLSPRSRARFGLQGPHLVGRHGSARGAWWGFLMKAKSEYSILDLTQNLYRLDESYWQGVVSNGLPGLSRIIKAPGILA